MRPELLNHAQLAQPRPKDGWNRPRFFEIRSGDGGVFTTLQMDFEVLGQGRGETAPRGYGPGKSELRLKVQADGLNRVESAYMRSRQFRTAGHLSQ